MNQLNKLLKQEKRIFKISFLKNATLLCCLLLLPLQANMKAMSATTIAEDSPFVTAPTTNIWQQPTYDKKIVEVGGRIITANEISKPITFLIMPGSEDVESTTSHKKNVIKIGSGILPFIQSDDELAAILGHEMAHLIHGEAGHFAGMSIFDILGTLIFVPEAIITTDDMGKSVSRKMGHVFKSNHESDVDLLGLKLMVKAGYNPVAMETVLTKIATDDENKRRRKRPSLELRKEKIHAEIRQHYPQYLVSEVKSPSVAMPLENNLESLPTKRSNIP